MKKRFILLAIVAILLTGCGSECKKHVDKNFDGFCDKCKENVVVAVDFYAINDLHGKFSDTDSQPGVDELTMYFKEQQSTNTFPVFISSGDMWQGSSESNLTRGGIIIDWMNELKFSSMTLGNHEFDWGEAAIRENGQKAEFPFLGINIFDRTTNERVDYCEPSVTVSYGGATIGIIGAMGDCYSSISSEQTENIYFKTGNDLTNLIKAEADRLRDEGCDYIVLSIHDGTTEDAIKPKVIADSKLAAHYNTVLSKGYVDLVFEGHTHSSYVLIDSQGVYHLQNGGDNFGISHVSVKINTANDIGFIQDAEIFRASEYGKLFKDSLRDDLLKKYDAEIGWVDEVIGQCENGLSKNELRKLAAQLYYEKGEEVWGSEYKIVLGGGFFSVRSPGYLKEGDVTYRDLQSVFPFDNELVLCKAKGSDIEKVFFNSTNQNYFMYYSDYGMEVKKNPDRNAYYYVVVDSYSSTYSYNNLIEVARLGKDIYLRDLLKDYFSKK